MVCSGRPRLRTADSVLHLESTEDRTWDEGFFSEDTTTDLACENWRSAHVNHYSLSVTDGEKPDQPVQDTDDHVVNGWKQRNEDIFVLPLNVPYLDTAESL